MLDPEPDRVDEAGGVEMALRPVRSQRETDAVVDIVELLPRQAQEARPHRIVRRIVRGGRCDGWMHGTSKRRLRRLGGRRKDAFDSHEPPEGTHKRKKGHEGRDPLFHDQTRPHPCCGVSYVLEDSEDPTKPASKLACTAIRCSLYVSNW